MKLYKVGEFRIIEAYFWLAKQIFALVLFMLIWNVLEMKAKRIFVLCNCNYVTLLESILQLSVRLFDLKRMGNGHEPIRIVNNMAFNIITYYKTKIKSNFFIQTDTNCCFFRSSYLTAAIICRIFRLLIDIFSLKFKIFF